MPSIFRLPKLNRPRDPDLRPMAGLGDTTAPLRGDPSGDDEPIDPSGAGGSSGTVMVVAGCCCG